MKNLLLTLIIAFFALSNVSFSQATQVDEVIPGGEANAITGVKKLTNDKVYRLDGVVFVNEGGVLEIQEGTVIVAEATSAGTVSALCINRGGKIMAKGTPEQPIVFTSAKPVGERLSGDWGGVLLMGKADVNRPGRDVEIEGGIANPATGAGMFGGKDTPNDNDDSGIMEYCRIEFAGYEAQPNQELNSLTMGAIGRTTTINNIHVSYAQDDAFEWFGGVADHKNLIATATLDDDIDVDNGFRGMIQFALVQRYPDIADISRSQSIETDNDSQGSYNQPFTSSIVSNLTSIGPVRNMADASGVSYDADYGAAIQIRRNSRLSVFNSVFVGWPAAFDFEAASGRGSQNTANAAAADSIQIRNCHFIGMQRFFRVDPVAPITEDWARAAANNNTFDIISNSPLELNAGNTFLANPFVEDDPNFDPTPTANAPFLTGTSYEKRGVVGIDNPFFERVDFKGAFALDGPRRRWDLPWAEYNPKNKAYAAGGNTSVETDEKGNRIPSTNILDLVVAPSVASSTTLFRFNLTNHSNVSINVINSLGVVVATPVANQSFEAGIYDFDFNVSELAQGNYIIQVITPNGVATSKMAVVR